MDANTSEFANHKPSSRMLAALVGLLIAIAIVLSPAAAQASPGEVKFMRNATSGFDGFITGSSGDQRKWMNNKYWRMRGYPPFFNQALGWAPDTHFYFDLYAIYNANRGDGLPDLRTLLDHPNWVLKDAAGKKLFIPYDCTGSTCTQYAADVGNPQWRRHWIELAADHMGDGYQGIHIDDVNMEFRVGDKSGNFVRPMDPRTGKPMTESNWQKYMAEFVEEVREAFPDAEISHNPIWWAPHGNKYVQRQIDAADIIELERGFNDGGLATGGGKYGYETFLSHVDWLHKRGKSIVLEPYGLNRKRAEYELAGYFLTKAMDDAIIGDYKTDPGNWWKGWETDLGKPKGKRKHRGTTVMRRYSGGVAIVNQPGASKSKVKLPKGKYRSISGKRVGRKVKLKGGTGLVLVRR